MTIKDIKQLQSERKWLQFSEAIKNFVKKENAKELSGLFIESMQQMHPTTIADTTLAMVDIMEPNEALNLIELARNSIVDTVLYSGIFENELIYIEVKNLLLYLKLGKLEGIEKKIFEWKHKQLPEGLFKEYNYLGFRFYEKIGNVENAFSYLLRYMELSHNFEMIDDLVKYALMSKNFFNLTSITHLIDNGKILDKNLKKVFSFFKEGNMEEVQKNESLLKSLFGDLSDQVKEKIYIIALINVCFAESSKMVSFTKIEETLSLNSEVSMNIILKAFGLGLIKGWIDGEKKLLYFDSIVPRSLNNDELLQMKERFNDWNEKVKSVISLLKN